ncbi:tumor necrosis factor receptor superfamily member 14-like [Brachyhypopomus gauderio]|uniref:tumor necrosis factor receptor superfamily member 14-like n=1 Tax=Brachyhypopomus gauderio TaxID=698409 RepID=UPI004042ACDD
MLRVLIFLHEYCPISALVSILWIFGSIRPTLDDTERKLTELSRATAQYLTQDNFSLCAADLLNVLTDELKTQWNIRVKMKSILTTAAVFLLNVAPCLCGCAWPEYEINGRCCPMCAAGNRVAEHCNQDVPDCVQCLPSTYTAEPNGLEQCLNCTVCSPEKGLRVKTQCTRTSDTVCEPLERHYCTGQVGGSCTQAEKHTACSAGHCIQQEGTAHKDTVCDVCPANTFSDGSLQTCQPHSRCEDLGLKAIKPGTNSTDVEYGKQTSVAVIAGIFGVVVVVVVAAVMVRKKMYTPVPTTV